jgi:hypothetical protein
MVQKIYKTIFFIPIVPFLRAGSRCCIFSRSLFTPGVRNMPAINLKRYSKIPKPLNPEISKFRNPCWTLLESRGQLINKSTSNTGEEDLLYKLKHGGYLESLFRLM